MAETREVSIVDVIDAMERNGYRQAHNGQWIVLTKEGKISKACAMGQAVINLNLDLDDFIHNFTPPQFRSGVMSMNDIDGFSCKKIAIEMRKIAPKRSWKDYKATIKTHDWSDAK